MTSKHPTGIFKYLRRSKWAGHGAKLGLSVLAFWLALHSVDFATLDDMVRAQGHGGLLGAVLLLVMQMVLGALRWQQILRALAAAKEHIITTREALKMYYISVFFNCCLPGTVGGDVVRVWLAKSDRVPLSLSINSVVIDRLIALAALAVLVVLTLPMLGAIAGFNAMLVLPLIVLVALAGLWFLIHIKRILAPFDHIAPVRWLLYFVQCLKLMLKHPFMSAASLFYAVVAHVSCCFAAYALAQSLGVEITIWQCVTLIPPVLLAATLPISIGGWGVREAGMVGLLALVGVPKAQALMISIELGLMYIFISLPAGLLWLVYRKHTPRTSEGLHFSPPAASHE